MQRRIGLKLGSKRAVCTSARFLPCLWQHAPGNSLLPKLKRSASTHRQEEHDGSLNATPAMRQYLAVKRDPQYTGCIVLFQLGGFYEAFYEDAAVLSSVCGVAYTARGDTPMAGLPIDRVDAHMLKLLRKGHRIVLVDQADPVGSPSLGSVVTAATRAAHAAAREAATGSRLIARTPSRVLTPGTGADIMGTSSASNHYVASVAFGMPSTVSSPGRGYSGPGDLFLPCAIAWTDVSTGELYVRTCTARDLSAELNDINPAEMVLPSLYPELSLSASAPIRSSPTSSQDTKWNSINTHQFPLPHIHESMAVELVSKLVKADHCKVVHEAQDQRRRAGGVPAPALPMSSGRHGAPMRLQFPGGDPDGSWLTFIPQTAFTAASSNVLSHFLVQHSHRHGEHGRITGTSSLPRASTPIDSTGLAKLEGIAALEVSALCGLLRYLSWAYCGNLPWLSMPISMTTRSSGGELKAEHASTAAEVGEQRLEPGEVDTPLSAASDLAAEIEQVAAEASTLITGLETDSHTVTGEQRNTGRSSFPSPLRMRINESTQRALELVRPMHGRRRAKGCLLELIDLCKTHMGSRLLDARLVRPLAQLEPLLHRLDAVEALAGPRNSVAGQLRTVLRSNGLLGGLPDLERCVQRASMGTSRGTLSATANLAKDLATIRDGLVVAQRIGALLVDGDSLLWSDTSAAPAGLQSRSNAIAKARAEALAAAERTLCHMDAALKQGSSPSAVQSLLLMSARSEFDVVNSVPGLFDGGKPDSMAGTAGLEAERAASPTRQSLVLAQCAAVLMSACTPAADAGNSLSPAFRSLSRAHREMQRALAQPGPGAESVPRAGSPPASTEADKTSEAGSTQSLSMSIRPGYSAELDAARARAANTGLLRRDLERILRSAVGLPPESPVLKIKGGVASILGAGRVADGLYIEVDVKAKPNAELLDRCLARQASSKAGHGPDKAIEEALQGVTLNAGSPFAKLKPSDLYLQAAKSTQTLKRFRCDALARLEVEVAEAGARAEALEARLITSLAALVLQADEAIKAVCKALAVVDVSSSLAELADKHVLVRPVLTEEGRLVRLHGMLSAGNSNGRDVGAGELMLKDARHLIVEHALSVWGSDTGQSVDDHTSALSQSVDDSPSAGAESDSTSEGYEVTHPRHASFVSNDILLGASMLDHIQGDVTSGPSVDPAAMASSQWHPLWDATIPQPLAGHLAQSRCVLLLGPNMGGKSTYLRTAAQAVILAQLGSFVPASTARIGLVDSIFCRVGASDDLAGHRSTFAVEMEEAAEILRRATRRSLVLVDELGRGTAAMEGLALAEAILHQLATTGARTLFATHFRELAATALRSTAVRGMEMEWHATVLPSCADDSLTKQDGRGILEGEEVEPGILVTHRVKLHSMYSQLSSHGRADVMQALGSSLSHGIAVAAHAGLPSTVLARARRTLTALQKAKASEAVVGVLLDSVSEGSRPRKARA